MDFKGPQTTRSIKLYEIKYKNIWKYEYHSKGVTIESIINNWPNEVRIKSTTFWFKANWSF